MRLVGILLLIPWAGASAATPLDDIVQVRNGKFVIDGTLVCEVAPEAKQAPVTLQVKTHSEAPTNVVSRDWFVAISTVLELDIRAGIVRASGLGVNLDNISAVDCEKRPEVSGDSDFDVDIQMTVDGVTFAMNDNSTGETATLDHTWADWGMQAPESKQTRK